MLTFREIIEFVNPGVDIVKVVRHYFQYWFGEYSDVWWHLEVYKQLVEEKLQLYHNEQDMVKIVFHPLA